MNGTLGGGSDAICYVMRSFPVLYQVGPLNEIRTLVNMGQRIQIFSILRPEPHECRDEPLDQWPSVTFCWETRAPRSGVLASNLAVLRRIGLTRYRQTYVLAREGGLVGDLRAFARVVYHAEEMKRQGISHFHAHWATEGTTMALVFSWLTGIPFSFTAHAYDIFQSPQFLSLKLREASFAVTVSEYNKQYMAEHFGAEYLDKIRVVYPLDDLSQFPLRAPPRSDQLKIVSVARLSECKGLRYLIEACHYLQERGIDFTCQIVGEGVERPLLEETIQRYNLGARVELLGTLQHDRIPPLLEQATVFSIPCVIGRDGSRDGMPLAMIEAMARGVPVVSTRVLGLPELVRDGAGLLVPPHDAEALADAIEQIYRLPRHEQAAMGLAGRRIVEEFEAPRGAKRMLELIRSVGSESISPLASGMTHEVKTDVSAHS